MTRTDVIWILKILAVGVIIIASLCVRYHQGIHHDSFNQHLAALAGNNAVCCSPPNSSLDEDAPMRLAMVKLIQQGKPFWGRDERHYQDIHSSDQWDRSEGFVFTGNGEMFQLNRVPPTIFRAARIKKYRINVPKPGANDRYLDLSRHTLVETYTLYP